MRLTNQEKNTLIAALTYYMDGGQGEPSSRADDIHALACGEVGGLTEDTSLDDEGIQDLMDKVWAS